MRVTRKQILAAAKAMTPAQRYDLIEDIRQILDDNELSPEQAAVLRRRLKSLDEGKMKTIPGEQVVAELREELRRRRRRRAS